MSLAYVHALSACPGALVAVRSTSFSDDPQYPPQLPTAASCPNALNPHGRRSQNGSSRRLKSHIRNITSRPRDYFPNTGAS